MLRITTHPGKVLREDFMVPLGLSANALSRALDVPPNRYHVHHCRGESARCHTGHCVASGALFRHHAGALAEPPASL